MLELEKKTMKNVEKSARVDLKKALKVSASNASFVGLKKKLMKHKKVKHIQYDCFKMQPYLRSENLQAEERQTITALRSKCVRSVKTNFSTMHKKRLNCPLNCNQENPYIDTQEHILICNKLNISNPSKLIIKGVFGSLVEQEEIGILFSKFMRQRTRQLDVLNNLPGDILDQSTLLQGAAVVYDI